MARNKLQFDINAKDKTKRAFSSLKRGLKGVSKAIFNMKTGLAAVAGVAGLGLLIRNSLISVDKIGKLSRQLFISTENLSAFRLAAELGGTSLEAFAKGARTMAVGINDWLVKGTGIAQDAFKQLKITQDDLRATNGDLMAQFELVADALQKVKKEGDKTAIAYKLFGGRNIELLTAIESGTAGMVEMSKEAKTLGLVLTTKMVRAIEDANDSVARTKLLFTGLANQFTVGLAPAIETASNKLRDTLLHYVKETHTDMEGFGKWLAEKFLNIVGQVGEAFIRLKYTIIGLGDSFDGLATNWKIFKTQALLFASGPAGWPGIMKLQMLKVKDSVVDNTAIMKQEIIDFHKVINGLGVESQDNEEKTNAASVLSAQKAAETKKQLIANLSSEAEKARLKNLERLEEEKRQQQLHFAHMQKLEWARIDAYEERVKKEKEIREKANANLRSDVEGTLTILSGHSKKAFKALKAYKIAEAIINTRSAAMKAFAAYGATPMGYLAVAAALAFGMAQVGQIRAQKYTGRRQGGIVSENKPYMVGEGGPEVMIPNSSGFISPHLGGKNINIAFTINATDVTGVKKLLIDNRATIVNVINSALNEKGRQALV